jgi:hypothetical protein
MLTGLGLCRYSVAQWTDDHDNHGDEFLFLYLARHGPYRYNTSEHFSSYVKSTLASS